MIIAIIAATILFIFVAFYFLIASQAPEYRSFGESPSLANQRKTLYAKDPEYEEAIIREADYFENNPDQWPGHGH